MTAAPSVRAILLSAADTPSHSRRNDRHNPPQSGRLCIVAIYHRGHGRLALPGLSSPAPAPIPLISTVIQGEVFTLLFRFDKDYPISSPAVQFVVDANQGKTSPVHPVRRLSVRSLL